ncbi:MAG: amidohydrolase family protein [Chloroflexi bacterium]|nr:amidohydrolase family protein [Chloroflexota bacterium]
MPDEIDRGAPLCLIHGRVIDGLGGPPIDDGYMLVEGATIRAVGRAADLRPASADARLVDVEGQTILPGLIDCHTHLVYSGFRSLEEIDRCAIETATINAILNAEKILRAGYTTIRDVGCIGNVAVAVRDAIAQGKVRGPRVVASGRIIAPTSGMIDTLPSHWERRMGLGICADGPNEVVKVVRQQIKDGVDNVKLGASGVEVGPYAYTWMTTMSEDEIRAAVHEAHRWGRTVAIHCQSYDAAKYALRAGADTVEHGTRLDDEAIDLFRRGQTVLVPTLCTLFSVLELGEKLSLLPKHREEMAVNHPLWLDSLRRAHAAGVPIAAGADIGNRYPHGSNARELGFLVRAGLTPMEAIVATTSGAARALRKADTLGALSPGKVADVVVIDGDPLADIRVLQDQARIRLVLQGGRVVAGSLWERAQARA